MCWCNIKCWIPTFNAMCSDSMFTDMCHFPIGTLFNHNLITTWYFQIDRCERCRNIKWNIMIFCNDSNLIGANFIGCITIGNNTIRTNNNRCNILCIENKSQWKTINFLIRIKKAFIVYSNSLLIVAMLQPYCQ